MRFPAKITSSCIWVVIPVDWVILHWYACGADKRSLGWSVYSHVIAKFSPMSKLLHFLTHGASLARFARKSSAMTSGRMLTAREIYFYKFVHERVFLRGLYNKSLKGWSLGKHWDSRETKFNCFPWDQSLIFKLFHQDTSRRFKMNDWQYLSLGDLEQNEVFPKGKSSGFLVP